MLRATSEIAVAKSVWSVLVSSSDPAIARACWRATTTSASDSIRITDSPSSGTVARLLARPLQQRQTLFQVERREHVLERHAQLHHRERDLGLDPHDHRLGAAQAGDPQYTLQR